MNDIIAISEQNQKKAWKVIENTNVMGIWESVGARPNLVGSLRTGLLMNNRDIDMHIYSDPFVLADSFTAMARLAEKKGIKRIEFANLLDTDEKCLEWHAWYQDTDGELWKMDMIHILSESVYAGYFEKVADRIKAALTPEIKYAILSIKNDMPPDLKVMGIQIYQAVIRDRVRNISQFLAWREEHPGDSIIDWMPSAG